MSHRNPTSLARFLPGAALGWCFWLCATAAGCAADRPADTDRLSSLSTGQLRALCEELGDVWADERPYVQCDNGWTVYPDSVGISACGSATSECRATAGEWRGCMRALAADVCQAAVQEPGECSVLRSREGCELLALPLHQQCTPPVVDAITALQGVYQIVSKTRNDAGCDGEGPVVQAQGYLALAATTYPGGLSTPLGRTPALGLVYCWYPALRSVDRTDWMHRCGSSRRASCGCCWSASSYP